MGLNAQKDNKNFRDDKKEKNPRPKGDMGFLPQEEKENHSVNRLRTSVNTALQSETYSQNIPNTRSSIGLHKKGDLGTLSEHLTIYKNDSAPPINFASENHILGTRKDDLMYQDAIDLYKSSVGFNSKTAIQPKNNDFEPDSEKDLLNRDAMYEKEEMERFNSDTQQMDQDEEKLAEDERKVEADKLRKFGRKHETPNADKRTERETSEVFEGDEMSKMQTTRTIAMKDADSNLLKVSKVDKRSLLSEDQEEEPFGLDEKSLRAFAGDDEKERKEHEEHEDSKILDGIADIFDVEISEIKSLHGASKKSFDERHSNVVTKKRRSKEYQHSTEKHGKVRNNSVTH